MSNEEISKIINDLNGTLWSLSSVKARIKVHDRIEKNEGPNGPMVGMLIESQLFADKAKLESKGALENFFDKEDYPKHYKNLSDKASKEFAKISGAPDKEEEAEQDNDL
jgi:hypothetical protein